MAEFADTIINLCRGGEAERSARQLGMLVTCFLEHGTPANRQIKILAAHLKAPKPSVVRAADRLEDDELIKREKIPGDRRSCVVTLTAKGMRMAKKIEKGFA